MTRKDQKALEKEIPYHMIPWEQWPLFQEALAKEWNVWKRFEAVCVLSVSDSKDVIDNTDPSRILPTRVCYNKDRNAKKVTTEVDANARIVAQGFNDPDLLGLRRDAPTLTRAGLMCILQVLCSFAWLLLAGDVTGAFLQGD